MMIAARLAGGNLFFCLFWVGGFLGGGIFGWGILGALGVARSTRSTRSTRIFFEGIFWVGDSFLGVVGSVLD